MSAHVRQTGLFRWEGIKVSPYKAQGTHFSGITRQLLFDAGDGLGCQVRYFEIEPGGYSSLERHHHAHAIIVVRGPGRALVGRRTFSSWPPMTSSGLPPLTWHQFRAGDEPFGFLCMVDCARDCPNAPTRRRWPRSGPSADVAAFIRT